MPIKDNIQLNKPEGDAWNGPWGSISPTPHSVTNLRLEKKADKPEKYLYPYRSFSRSLWIGGELETIEILAGNDRVILTGKGLEPLLAAIDTEQLQWVGETPECRGEELETAIYSIQVETQESDPSGG